MKKILFIDDDEIRVSAAKAYYQNWLKEEIEFTHRIDLWVPGEELPYDIISFDNDLGEDGDVIRLLRIRYFREFDTLEKDLSGKILIIHSCNSVASESLMNLFSDMAFPVFRISFNQMVI